MIFLVIKNFVLENISSVYMPFVCMPFLIISSSKMLGVRLGFFCFVLFFFLTGMV